MKSWSSGRRVLVREVGSHGSTMPLREARPGTVVRVLMRNSREAWVKLDKRLTGDEERHHPFPADDSRGCDVATDVEACAPLLEVLR